MNSNELHNLEDPDLFAAEMQHLLLTEGPKSKNVRQLMRLARRHPDAELDRIFETKLAEYRRASREDRVPSLINLPLRCWEWLFENARLTPPRDVLMTLVYVVVVLVLFEGLKEHVPLRQFFSQLLELRHGTAAPRETEYDPFRQPAPVQDVAANVDGWFTDELQRAAESPRFRDLLTRQIAETIAKQEGQAALTEVFDRLFAAETFQSSLRGRILESMGSLEPDLSKAIDQGKIKERIVGEVAVALGQDEFRAQVQQAVQDAFASQAVTDLVTSELSAKLKKVDFKTLVQQALPEMGADELLAEKLVAALKKATESVDVGQQMKSAAVEAAGSTDARNALQATIASLISSDEFKKQLAAAVRQALEPQKPVTANLTPPVPPPGGTP